jgi:glutamyl-tRNA reductase
VDQQRSEIKNELNQEAEPGVDFNIHGWPMIFQLIGVNHRSAPLQVRERFAIPEARLQDAIARLAKFRGVEEAFVVSTCNRTDLLVCSRDGNLDLRAFLADYFQIPAAEFEPYVYEHTGADAIRHLFRVTASLDSMVIGEPQILGQVKEAYAVARVGGRSTPISMP